MLKELVSFVKMNLFPLRKLSKSSNILSAWLVSLMCMGSDLTNGATPLGLNSGR